jgi:Shugoshin C terminus
MLKDNLLTIYRATEIQGLLSDPAADNTDSPDIGPPPVSQFINEDPVKIDLPTKGDTNKEEISDIDRARSINLEQRRKRRDSTAPPEQKRASRFEPGPGQSGKEAAQPLKTGAKRKLSTREDEDGASNTKPTETSPDDFKYTRKTIEEQPQSNASGAAPSKPQREFAVAKGAHREKTSSTAPLNTRRALGPKTANTDVANSPKKNSKQVLSDDIPSEKGEIPKKDQLKERSRERKSELLRIKATAQPVGTTINIEPEPETPAAPDIFSPPESGSSAIRAESRDTPPPPDLGPGMEGQRPSRRARGSVSYAEPNLRDKMRRPTKDLVDAVTGEGKAQRLSIVKLESDAPTTARKIKEEPDIDNAWKSMPSASMVNEYSKSPLVGKANSRETMPRSLTTERYRRRSSIHQVTENEVSRSGSSSAISALLGGPRKLREEQNDRGEGKDSLNRAMAKLDIYEFTGSSPREPSDSRIPAVKAAWHVSGTRRPSSNAQDPMTANTTEGSDREQSARSLESSSRRRQSMIGIGASTSNAESEGQKQADELRKSSSHSVLSQGEEARSERVSARRRSMML